MPGVQRSIEIKAPIERVFDVISDFESYPKLVANMKSVTIDKRTKTSVTVTFVIVVVVDIRYTLTLKLASPKSITWTLVDGNMMRSNDGSWTFEALSPKVTKATYAIDIAFGPLVPKKIVNMLVESSLPDMMAAFKKKAEAKK